MEFERDVLVSPTAEVPVVEGELVTAIRTLADRGVGKKTIAREVGVALNTVRRYLRRSHRGGCSGSAGGAWVGVFLLVAVLSYSRRLFVKAFLAERQDDWRDGIGAAFTHFGGVPRTLRGDNARALVTGRDRATGTVLFHPGYLAFCRDWDVQPRACAPYHARPKARPKPA